MMANFEQLALTTCLLAPFVTAALSLWAHRKPMLRDVVNLSLPFVALLAAALLWTQGSGLSSLTLHTGINIVSVPIAFHIEPVGAFFAGLVFVLWPLAMLYSLAYLSKTNDTNQTRFLVFYNLSVGAAIAIAFSANLLTLFIFYEVLTLCTYPLVTHSKTEEAKKAGRFYLLVLLTTSAVFLLLAIIFVWHLAGHLDFVHGGILQGALDPSWAPFLLALFIAGIAKAAIMPLHQWLPKAMVAPVPVSALLHAVAVVKAGVFTIVKVMIYTFGTDFLTLADTQWLIYLACFTIVLASVIALRQTQIKKLLAYSTVSQLSYIILGAALLKPLAIVAAVFHIVAHGLAKIALFFAAGAMQTQNRLTQTDQVYGIGRYMPWTMLAFTIASLSIIGLPPLFGFVSKWFLLSTASASAQYVVSATIVISTLLNAFYFLPIIFRAYFTKPLATPAAQAAQAAKAEQALGEAPTAMLIAMLVPVALCLLCFFYADGLMQFLMAAAGPLGGL